MTKLVRPLRSGQITIPAEFRRQLGISESSLLQVTLEEDALRITRVTVAAPASAPSGANAWLRGLYEQFAPVRVETAAVSEAELNADIDAAVQAVRRTRARG